MAKEFDIEVEGRAYLLRPDTPREGVERPARPGETDDELSEPLRGQARESGLIMRPSSRTPNTLYSLEATEYAQQRGKFLEFHHAAYKAFWEDRKDIGQIEALETIADSVGLDGAELVKALEQGVYSQTVIAQYREALQYGINGIPTFLVGDPAAGPRQALLFTGAHPYPVFKQAMERYLSQ